MLISALLQPGFVSTVSADPLSPLLVTKTANPSPVASGGQLTYTIAIKNTGGAKVDSVVMTDQVNGVGTVQSPPGLPQLTITSTQGPCAQGGANGNVVTCQIGTISGGATVTITIRGQVTASNGTSLNNTASVTGTKSAQNFTTNASVSVLVQGSGGGGSSPDLTLNKTGPTSVATGANMDYVLTVNNLGNANTANVKVVDTLPIGVALSSYETTSLFSCLPLAPVAAGASAITVTCTGGAVNAGQNATIKIHTVAPVTAGTITNTAIVDPDNAIAESNELNNASAAVNTNVTTAPPTPALTIFKTDNNPNVYPWSTGAGPDPVNPGQILTYKIQAKNVATTRADDVVITDGTQGLEASSIVASQVIANGTVGNTGGCFVSAPQVTCKVRTLNPGGTITITITGTVVSTAGATIFNTATVTGNIKNQGVSATDSESTTVRPAIDFTITKSDSPDPVCARSWPTTNPNQHLINPPDGLTAADGSPTPLLAPPVCLGGLTYTFVVGNSGNVNATGVQVRDVLATGVILDSYSTNGGFACAVDASNVVNCTGGSVPAASTRTITFRVVAPPTLGTLTNSVMVDPNNAIFEPDEQNNDATTTTDVRTGIDLVIWKGDKGPATPPADDPPGGAPPLTEGFDNIATSGTGTYTIIVDNVGTQNSTGIKVVDTLPAGTKFLSVTSDQGFTCQHDGSATGGLVTCIGGHLLGTESEFYDPAGPPPAGPGDEWATIKIKFFATPFVQQVGQLMHNIVRVDPDNTIDEVNELNNLATDDTVVTVGNDNIGAFNQLTVDKTQTSPAANGAVATNGILIYNLHVSNLGTDPVSNVVLQDTLPSGTRFISAKDTATGSAAFFCSHDNSVTGGVITCTGGDFSGSANVIAGVPIARDVTVKVFAPSTPQTITNTAVVDPANIVPEGNEFDNDDQQNTDVAPCTSLGDCGTKNAVYELTIDKAQNRSTIARNGLETYTLTVTNLGSDPISGITVQDILPAGSRFFDAKDTAVPPTNPAAFTCSHDGAPTGGTVTCIGGVLSGTNALIALPGVPTSRQIQIRAFMPDTPGTYTNRSVVDPAHSIPEGNEFNNESSVETVVANGGANPYIDLQIDKTQPIELDQDTPGGAGTPVRVDTGQGIHYVLEVKNVGEGDAFNVTVRDVIPAGATYFIASDAATGAGMFTCTFSAPNVDCTGGTIPAGGSRTINVILVAPTHLDQIASDPGHIKQLITNQAFVDPFNAIGEGDETNNSDSIQTIVESQVNLTIKKEGPSGASQNETTEYKITVTNNKTWGDGRTVFGVKIVDPLPVGLIPIGSVEAGGNFTCQVEENPVNTVTCVGDLAPTPDADPVEITIHVFITADGGTLDNEACVDPGHLIDETSELDNCKTAITEVTPAVADLAANKTADKGTVTAGETLTYTVAVINQGTATMSGTVTMNDPLPSQVTFVNVNPDAGWTCSGTSTVNCTRSGLGAGATSNIKIIVTVNTGATGPFTNDATVTGNSQTKHGIVTTSVGGSAIDLVLSGLSDNPDPANVGQNITYTFAVSNGGSSPSGSFDIKAKMDTGALSGLDFVGAAASQGFICGDISTDTVTCTGSLPAGQSTNVSIVFEVLAETPTTHTLDVKVDEANAVTESTKANNNDTEVTTVTGSLCTSCVDLVAGGILVTPDPVTGGGALTRIATVSNAGDVSTAVLGPDKAQVWVYFDGTLETLGTYSATGGFTCTDFTFFGLVVVECSGDLGPGQGVAVTVNSTASGAVDGDLLTATVYADPYDNFPEGTGSDHEFTDANNSAIVSTSVVGP